jgi:hypothetical protein
MGLVGKNIDYDYDIDFLNDSILTFGCSFTSGPFLCATENIPCWPLHLSNMVDCNVINFAQGGSCLLYSIQQLEWVLNSGIKPKFVFFQMTKSPRVSIIPKPEPHCIIKKFPNYYQTGTADLLTSNPSTLRDGHFKEYWKHFIINNTPLYETNLRAQVSYLKQLMSKVNGLIFSQIPDDFYKGVAEFDVQNRIFKGKPAYQSHCIDDGGHLSSGGLLKQARFLKMKLDKRIKL